MAKETKEKTRKRVVVEEINSSPQIQSDTATDINNEAPVEEIKEKVEELQTLTEGITESAEKQSEVQEQIVEAAEKVEPKIEDFAPPSSRVRSGLNPLIILIPGVLLLGALLGGIYFYQKNINSISQPTPTPQVAVSPSVSPSATPSVKLDLTKYPINIENGSGIPGTAGTVKSLLTKAGFKVEATGNADNFNYTDSVIQTKSDVPSDFVTKLNATLSSAYSVSKAQSLPDSSKDEVLVIVGSSKAQ